MDATSGSTMQERGTSSRIRLWVLMEADRWQLTTVLTGSVALGVVAAGVAVPEMFREVVTEDPLIGELFVGFVTTTITAVTLIVSIGQLVLSQELGAVGDQKERMDASISFQQTVESYLPQAVSPAEPSSFMQVIVIEINTKATALAESLANSTGETDELESFLHTLVSDTDSIATSLSGTEFGTFDMISAALNFAYSSYLHRGRELHATYEPALDDTEAELFEDLLSVLTLFAPAREHFKTLYFQWELINLSRSIMYVALPSLVTGIWIGLFLNPERVTGTLLGVDALVLVIAIAVAIVILPFVLLLSHMFRITTVAKRTLAMGPFILRTRTNET